MSLGDQLNILHDELDDISKKIEKTLSRMGHIGASASYTRSKLRNTERKITDAEDEAHTFLFRQNGDLRAPGGLIRNWKNNQSRWQPKLRAQVKGLIFKQDGQPRAPSVIIRNQRKFESKWPGLQQYISKIQKYEDDIAIYSHNYAQEQGYLDRLRAREAEIEKEIKRIKDLIEKVGKIFFEVDSTFVKQESGVNFYKFNPNIYAQVDHIDYMIANRDATRLKIIEAINKYINEQKKDYKTLHSIDPKKDYLVHALVNVKVDKLDAKGKKYTAHYSLWFPPFGTQYIASGSQGLYKMLYAAVSLFSRKLYDTTWDGSYDYELESIDAFTVLRAETYTKGIFKPKMASPLFTMPMKGATLMMANTMEFLHNRQVINNLCVPIGIFQCVAKDNNRHKKQLTLKVIVDQLYDIANPQEEQTNDLLKQLCSSSSSLSHEEKIAYIQERGITPEEMDIWARDNDVSLYVYDILGQLLFKRTKVGGTKIVCTAHDNHCYIHDPDFKPDTQYTMKRIRDPKMFGDFTVVSIYDKIDFTEHKNGFLIIPDTNNLIKLVLEVRKESNHQVTYLQLKKKCVVAFKHPVTNTVVQANPEYAEEKACCDYFYNLYKHQDLRFISRGIPSMTKTLRSFLEHNEIPESHYPPSLFKFINDPSERKSMVPIISSMPYTDEEVKAYFGVSDLSKLFVVEADIRRAYGTFIETMEYDFSLFLSFEKDVDFDPNVHIVNGKCVEGYYYVNRDFGAFFQNDRHTFTFSAGIYKPNSIDKYLAKKYITYKDITHVLRPRKTLDRKLLKPYRKLLFDLETQGKFQSKKFINNLWGVLGIKESKKEYGALASSQEMAERICEHEWHMHKRISSLYRLGEDYYVTSETRVPLKTGHVPINHQILCQGMVEISNLFDLLSPHGLVSGYKTDCVYLICTEEKIDAIKDIIEKSNSEVTYRISSIVPYEDYERYGSEPLPIRPGTIPHPYLGGWNKVTYTADKLPTQSGFISAKGGAGKSWMVTSWDPLAKEEEKTILYLSSVHKGCDVLRQYGVEPETVDHFFSEGGEYKKTDEQHRRKCARYDIIVVDEGSSLRKQHIRYFDRYLSPSTILIIAGDMEQNPPVEKDDNDPLNYDYEQAPIFQSICGYNRYDMPYNPDTGRYDETLLGPINRLSAHGTIDISLFPKGSMDDNLHIVATNKMGDFIDQQVLTRHLENRKPIKIKHNAEIRDHYIGIPLVCINNPRREDDIVDIKNNSWYTLVDYNDTDGAVLERRDDKQIFYVKPSVLFRRFKYGFALTSYRIQGETIREPYTIHEAHRMTRNEIDVAIGRGTTINHVRFSHTVGKHNHFCRNSECPHRGMFQQIQERIRKEAGEIKMSADGTIIMPKEAKEERKIKKECEDCVCNVDNNTYYYPKQFAIYRYPTEPIQPIERDITLICKKDDKVFGVTISGKQRIDKETKERKFNISKEEDEYYVPPKNPYYNFDSEQMQYSRKETKVEDDNISKAKHGDILYCPSLTTLIDSPYTEMIKVCQALRSKVDGFLEVVETKDAKDYIDNLSNVKEEKPISLKRRKKPVVVKDVRRPELHWDDKNKRYRINAHGKRYHFSVAEHGSKKEAERKAKEMAERIYEEDGGV